MSIKQGEFLKELRVNNNYSQEKLGELLGLSRQSISKWEQGYASPDTENLLKLSELYGVSVDTILKCGEEETERKSENVAESVTKDNAEAVEETDMETAPETEINDEKTSVENDKPNKRKRGWFFISYPVLAVIAYAIIGALFKSKGWAIGWTILLTIPLYYTGVIAMEKKKPVIFCYPVLALLIFLLGGLLYSFWHPLWIIFLTIPVFYIIAAKAGKNK